MSRYSLIKACRPVVEINKNKNSLETEKFQNEVLRPILKFQNKLLIALFINTCKKSKSDFFAWNKIQKQTYIEQVFKKDNKVKILFIGLVLALLTTEEVEIYYQNESEFNKRILTMLIERLKNQISQLN